MLRGHPMAPFYVTTPIYYVNALPHHGTFYTTVVADALARYHRARGDRTFFLTGLDEHGLKIQRIAAERGISEQAYTDEIGAKFQDAWRRVEISNDDFIRTTQARHQESVAEIWRRLQARGDIDTRPARSCARSTASRSSWSRRRTTSSTCPAIRTICWSCTRRRASSGPNRAATRSSRSCAAG